MRHRAIPDCLLITRRTWLEFLLTLLVLAALVNVIVRFNIDGKLPQPFLFDVNDTFMDWFNTAFWAHNPGAFSVWRTVYPPISFVFVRLLGLPGCYDASGMVARNCDQVGVVAILCCYVLCAIVAAAAFRRRDRATWLWRSTSFGVGLPLLFTLERGNLILAAFVFYALLHGGLLRSPWKRAVAVGIMVNFKPYLLITVLAPAFKRDWPELERAAIGVVAVYLATYGLMGAGSLSEIASNTANWVLFMSGQLLEGIYYSTSFTPFLEFNTPLFPVRDVIPSRTVDAMLLAIPIIIRTSQLLLLLTLVGAWLQPHALTTQRIATVILAAYLVSQSPGGYAEVFLIFLLFLEPWRGKGPIIALIAGYLLSIPYDYVVSTIVTLTSDSWLSGRSVVAPFGIAVGTFLRPALVVILFWGLALDSLARIIAIHRTSRPTIDPHPQAMVPVPARSMYKPLTLGVVHQKS